MTWQTTRQLSAEAARACGRMAGAQLRRGAQRVFDVATLPDVATLTEGELVSLPGRGETYVVDLPGPTPDSPTVLLMHAVATTGYLTWFAAIGELRKQYRVVLFDQRWHGRGIATGPFTLEDCADDAAAVLDYLGIEGATVLGYSMGGATAQLLWRRHPDLVDGLVLCSTAASWRRHIGETGFYSLLGVLNGSVLSDAEQRVRDHAGRNRLLETDDITSWCLHELRRTSFWALPSALAALGSFDSREWIGEVDVPTAVVVTVRDKAISAASQRALGEAIRGAVIHEVPGGHTSLVTDREHWVPTLLAAVAEVIERQPPRAAEREVS